MEKTFYIHTLGCKVNQYNSQIIRENLVNRGFQEKEEGSFQIVNGCIVTQKAERKTRKYIYKSKKIGKKTLVTGCYARGNPSLREGVFIPNEKELIEYITGEKPPITTISSFQSHSRAFVKIQEGCSSSCSYCIIPKVRGKVYSRKENEILEEVGCLSPFYPEIVITGTHLGLYKLFRPKYLDSNGKDLAYLLEKILKRAEFSRIRLSSIEINEITPHLLSLFSHPRLCTHLHIPLQSGSDRILKLMRRPYTRRTFLNIINRVKKEFPQIAFTTDIMVGFPTEEEDDFQDTMEVGEKVGFLRIHIFPYSERKGTMADKLLPKVEEKTKKEREKRIEDLATHLSFNLRKKFIGKRKEVLLEKKMRNGRLWGYSEDYIPVSMENHSDILLGKIYNVLITKVNKDSTEAIF